MGIKISIQVQIRDLQILIDNELIERDIATLEKREKVARYFDGVFIAPRPNIHGLLVCMRDNRRYDANQIEDVCRKVCPFYSPRKTADDYLHLDDCRKLLFEGTSLDGKTRYMQITHN